MGLCLDSSQPVSAGACYQNTIRDLVITAVDVGLYAGKWVNVRDPAHFMLLVVVVVLLLVLLCLLVVPCFAAGAGADGTPEDNYAGCTCFFSGERV